jgi:hypothetical protein
MKRVLRALALTAIVAGFLFLAAALAAMIWTGEGFSTPGFLKW